MHADGLKRRVGSYDDAEWSPHGLYVVATRRNELAAIDAEEGVRWTLARRDVRYPRWEGTRTDTRIAYLAASGLRVVAGDGTATTCSTGTRRTSRRPGTRPGCTSLAYVSGGSVVLRDVERRRSSGARRSASLPTALAVVLRRPRSRGGLGPAHRRAGRERPRAPHRSRCSARSSCAAAFRPASHKLAVATRFAGHSEVKLVDVDHPGTAKLLFAGPGVFGDLAWSPDGDWLLVDWPTANQWVFLHGAHVQAVANIRERVPARATTSGRGCELAGRWCCR